MNLKYLIFDIIKVLIPLITAQFLPEGAPQSEIIQVAMYLLALLLGADAAQKTRAAVDASKPAE